MAEMATSLFGPVEEYLRTVYRPDCDYVDGVLEERNLGEVDHGYVQNNIGAAFKFRSQQTGLIAITECRVQTKPTRFRIPDLVVTRGKPLEQFLTQPPVLCVDNSVSRGPASSGACPYSRIPRLRCPCRLADRSRAKDSDDLSERFFRAGDSAFRSSERD